MPRSSELNSLQITEKCVCICAVPKMKGPPSLQARIDEQSRTGSYASYSDPSTGIEEADSVVETLLVMEHADRGSLNRFMVSTCMKSDMVSGKHDPWLQAS